jgi:cysteine desulfurase
MINYLDNNATTPMLPEVRTLLLKEILTMGPSNPSSIHSVGRNAKNLIEAARKTVINSLNASLKDFHVIFTSSGTEANNTIIKGISADTVLFISEIEHASLLKPAQNRKNTYFISVTNDGIVDLNHLEKTLQSDTTSKKLISIMLANNETGAIQNLHQVIELGKKYNAFVHSDASQAFGKISIDLEKLPLDAITIASHKIGGPLGAAALIKRKILKIIPLIEGGPQEHGLRAGTENIVAILGFAEAIKYIDRTLSQYQAQKPHRDYLEKQLKSIDKNLKIYAQNKIRLPNTSCVASSVFNNEIQQMHLDLENIAISSGSACASGKINKSHVLSAMNNNDPMISNAIRISLGMNSTKKDVDIFLTSWQKLYKHN